MNGSISDPLAPFAFVLALAGCGMNLPQPEGPDSRGPGGSTSGDAEDTTRASSLGATVTSGVDGATSISGDDAGLDTSSAGATFIDDPGCGEAPDGSHWRCSTISCDVADPDSCPEDEKCMPWANDGGLAWNDSRCVPVQPEASPPGESCAVQGSPVSGVDDCELSSMCWGVDPRTLLGTCEAFCDPTDPDACAAEHGCVEINEGTFAVCLARCDPLDAGSCPGGEQCRVVGQERPYCLPAVGGVVYESSGFCGATTCAADALCVDAESVPACTESCCTPWCDTSDPEADAGCAAADPALVCVPFYDFPAPEGLESLGLCAVPPLG